MHRNQKMKFGALSTKKGAEIFLTLKDVGQGATIITILFWFLYTYFICMRYNKNVIQRNPSREVLNGVQCILSNNVKSSQKKILLKFVNNISKLCINSLPLIQAYVLGGNKNTNVSKYNIQNVVACIYWLLLLLFAVVYLGY